MVFPVFSSNFCFFCLFVCFSAAFCFMSLQCLALIVNNGEPPHAAPPPAFVSSAIHGVRGGSILNESNSAHLGRTKSFTPTRNLRAVSVAGGEGGTNVQENDQMGGIDLRGKVAFIAGVGDSSGYGWSIAKRLAAAGATIALGTWPPVLSIFKKSLEMGKFDEDMKLPDGSKMVISQIYPLDATFDTPQDVPDDIKHNKRYVGVEGYTISEVAERIEKDYGKIDILVHSLANGPEVKKPLLETSRQGYLAANSASAFSFVSLVQKFASKMNRGGSILSLTYIASERVIPGYGGGMSSAKAALESDTKTLAWEAGRKYGLRVNTISAGPLKSRAASAIGNEGGKSFIEYAIDYSIANSPLQQHLYAEDVANSALFLLSPMSRAVTGVTLYVDNGLHAMGQAVDSNSLQKQTTTP